MDKFFSAAKPQTFERFDAGHILVAYNVEELTSEEGEKSYQFDTVLVEEPTYEALTVALIRRQYDANEELALLRKKAAGVECDFEAYNEFVESCKALAKSIVGAEA